MSKKNNKKTRARQHVFDLQREKEEIKKKERRKKQAEKKLKASGGVKLKRPRKTKRGKLSEAAKTAVVKAMDIDSTES